MKRGRQSGATMVEFALIFIVFMTFLLGIIDFSRMLWTWNAANEATRWGARTAVVCDKNSPMILSNMKKFLPQLTAGDVEINWYGADGNVNNACTSSSCAGVGVRIVNLKYQWISPVGFSNYGSIPMPGFSTYLPRESMGQDVNSPDICS